MKFFPSLAVLIFLLFFTSCGEDDYITDNSPCPPIDIVPIPPYDSPVWHPHGEIIGFNYRPLKEIQYPYGDHCLGEQKWDHDSSGFWLIDSDGKNMRRVLPFQLQTPDWSPDGLWLAFVYSNQIYKMRFDGMEFDTTSITQLTFTGRNYFPAWSPDGNWIAYDSNIVNTDSTEIYRLWKMDSNGNNKVRILNEGSRMPAWSHGMSHLLFRGSYHDIYKFEFNRDTTTRITFMNEETPYSFDNSHPQYLPNSSDIIFLSQGKEEFPNIFRMDSCGSNIQKLTEDGVDGYSWTLSPDGRYMVYTKYDWNDWGYDNGTIWVFDMNNGSEYQLTFNDPPNE